MLTTTSSTNPEFTLCGKVICSFSTRSKQGCDCHACSPTWIQTSFFWKKEKHDKKKLPTWFMLPSQNTANQTLKHLWEWKLEMMNAELLLCHPPWSPVGGLRRRQVTKNESLSPNNKHEWECWDCVPHLTSLKRKLCLGKQTKPTYVYLKMSGLFKMVGKLLLTAMRWNCFGKIQLLLLRMTNEWCGTKWPWTTWLMVCQDTWAWPWSCVTWLQEPAWALSPSDRVDAMPGLSWWYPRNH